MKNRFLLLIGILLGTATAAYGVAINGQLGGARFENIASDPTGTLGRIYLNSSTNVPKYYNGTAWKTFAPLESPTFTGTASGSFSGSLVGNASTATALAANPTDCSAGQYGASIDANGNLTCSQVTLDQIGSPAANGSINMSNKTFDWNFTNPSGGMMWNFTGAASGHALEIKQSTGNPDSSMHLLHIEASDADPTLLHLAGGSATSRALKVNPLGDTVTNPGRFEIDASGKHTWGTGGGATDVSLYRSGVGTLTTDGTIAGTFTGNVTGTASGNIANALVDAKGDLVTATADNTPARLATGSYGQVLTADSSTATGLKWASAASSSNLLTKIDAEDNVTTGWSEGTVSLTGAGPNIQPTGAITGGSITQWSTTNTSPLAGSYSYKYTKNASAGRVVYQNFTLPRELRGATITIGFTYEITGSFSNNDMVVGIYANDGTVTGWNPSVIPFNIAPKSGPGTFMATFPATSDGSSYTVAIVQTTTGSWTSMAMDSFFVGKKETSSGPPLTDWQSFTGSMAYAGTAATNITSQTYKYRRVGDTAEISAKIIFNGNANANGQFQIPMPAGVAIDVNKDPGSYTLDGDAQLSTISKVFRGQIRKDNQNTGYVAIVRADDGGATDQVWGVHSTTAGNNVPSGAFLSNTDQLSVIFRVPVSGWSSNVSMVDTARTTPTIQKFTSGSGTYTTPPGVKYIRVRMVGGGGGGAGSAASGTDNGGAGGTGGTTTFGSSLLTCTGGSGATSPSGQSGAGGSYTLNSPAIGIGWTGAKGQGVNLTIAGAYQPGGLGGVSPFGGANWAANASTNSGSGGSGQGSPSGGYPGAGGGAGGYLDAVIENPAATYAYSVGSAGTAGGAGTGGSAAFTGGSGVIIVEEYYRSEGALAGSDSVGLDVTTSSQALGNATYDLVVFTNVVKDSAGKYSGGTWTCPLAGWYTVSAMVYHGIRSSAAHDFTFEIRKNGGSFARGMAYESYPSSSHGFIFPVTKSVYLSAGDTIAVYARAGYSGGSLDGNSYSNYLSIVRNGP